jgi:NADPH:quinone reductase-like Zn-dependent oxidoreductase
MATHGSCRNIKKIRKMAPTTEHILPTTMRSWVRTRRSSTLQLASIPTPDVPTEPSSDVLIRVSHVSLQVSTKMMIKAIPSLPFSGPWVPELELSGYIVAAGGGAPAELRTPGTPVIAFRNSLAAMLMGHGVLAEYVRLPSNQVCLIDPAVDMAAASGIHCSGSAALNMIRTAGVREGHRVLVNGASGSAGSLLVQLCKIRGATVVGVASGGNEAMVRGLGADEVSAPCDFSDEDIMMANCAYSSLTIDNTSLFPRILRKCTAIGSSILFWTVSALKSSLCTRQII